MDAKASNKTATLTVGNKNYDLPIHSGSVGPDVIDIGKLYGQSGLFTYDPGFHVDRKLPVQDHLYRR
ncbi:hypothetical protein ABIF73_003201 [Bradyrhizobium japonicum]